MDYSSFLSIKGSKRDPMPEKLTMSYQLNDGWIAFGAGIPNPGFYPFFSMNITVNDENKSIMNIDHGELSDAQNYSQGFGNLKLLQQLKDFQIRYHNLNESSFGTEWDLCLVNGAQHGLSVVFEMLLNNGDCILMEEPTYGGIFGITQPRNLKLIGIEMDEEGIKPDVLESTLLNWNSELPFPKLLYLIPTGQNPTGIIMSKQRRKKVLEIAETFNLLIIEDDPHYFLQYGKDKDEHLDSIDLEESLLSMNKERVIRIDTFSKILSGGLRLGFITAPPFLTTRFSEEVNGTMFHISGMTQILYSKLFECWGEDGWTTHIRKVQRYLKFKRNEMKKSLDKHLGELVEYRLPDAGMYFWLKFPKLSNTFDFMFNEMFEHKVLFGPGSGYSTNNGQNQYVRACFSFIDPEIIDKSIETLGVVLKEHISKEQKSGTPIN